MSPAPPGGTGGTLGSKREQERGGGEQRPGVSRGRGGDRGDWRRGERVKAENLEAIGPTTLRRSVLTRGNASLQLGELTGTGRVLCRPDTLQRICAACVCVCACAQPCSTLCDPTDCSPPGSSVHGILQARILEWVPMPSSRASSPPRDRTRVSGVSGTGRRILQH